MKFGFPNTYRSFAFTIILLFLIGQGCLLFAQQPEAARLENEYKLAIPDGDAEKVWEFLSQQYIDQVSKLGEQFNASVSDEFFVDQYYDTDDDLMYESWAGIRHRLRYVADTLSKELVQIKLTGKDKNNPIREERKFDINSNPKRSDPLAAHPFLKYVKPKDREQVNLILAPFSITAEDLEISTKVKQRRRRLYLKDGEIPTLTITLDEVVSAYFPYSTYTEMEIELNEVRYTAGDANLKASMEVLNKKVKAELMEEFPTIKQDQTPKYNKMKMRLDKNIWALAYDNLMYILSGSLILFAGVLVIVKKDLL